MEPEIALSRGRRKQRRAPQNHHVSDLSEPNFR
jgi:hypothetical protein